MKILFDQGTPVPLRRYLLGHTVDTAYERGWSELSNGDLLTTAERENYDLLITTDQNLRYQQNSAWYATETHTIRRSATHSCEWCKS